MNEMLIDKPLITNYKLFVMTKVDEIKRKLNDAIERYDACRKANDVDGAKAAAQEVKALTDELNEERVMEAARREAAARDLTEQEKRELNRFSFAKFIREAGRKELSGFEKEMADEGRREAQQLGLSVGGFAIPHVLLANKRAAAGQNVTTPADGGMLVGTEMTYIEQLRKKLFLTELGATMLTGLQGNIDLIMGSKFTAKWLGETDKVTTEKLQFSKSTLSPKRLAMMGAFSNMLLVQASTDVERLIVDELVAAHAIALNEAAINGSGASNQPKGILNMDNVGAVAGGDNGAAISYANVVALETAISAKDADFGNMAYLTNSKVVGAMKTTEKATGTARYILEGGLANGYRVHTSNIVPDKLTKGEAASKCSAMVFGNWSDLLVAWWGGLDLIVDPYTMADSDEVRVVARAFHDVGVRHEESFAVIKDILA